LILFLPDHVISKPNEASQSFIAAAKNLYAGSAVDNFALLPGPWKIPDNPSVDRTDAYSK
jgi:hypothetical protein